MKHSRMERMSWRKFSRGCMAIAAVYAAACSDNGSPVSPGGSQTPASAIETHPTQRPQFSSVHASAPIIQSCGATTTYAMWSNPYVPGGSVVVSNDADNIYVTYNVTDPDWYITDTRLAVEKDKSAIPMEDANTPAPWSFNHAGVHDPAVHTFTYTIKLTSVNATAGETVYVSAMSGVVYPVTGDYDGDWEWRTAWAVPQGKTSPLIQAYVVQSCGGTTTPPTDTTTTPTDTTKTPTDTTKTPTDTTPTPPPPPSGGGIITISFDDGWAETYTIAFPILKQLGIAGNANINSEPIDGGWSAYMTLPQVKALHNAGWSIESHSTTHPDLTQVSAAQLDSELKANKAWIAANGLGDSPVFVVPFHSWGTRELTAVKKYYKAARGYTIDQFDPEQFQPTSFPDPYMLTAFEPEFAPFTTADGRALTMSKIKYAVDNGLFLDVFFHHLTAKQQPGFQELMNEIVSKYKANIRTYDQIF